MTDRSTPGGSNQEELSEGDGLLPIRMIESLRYCPRQAWYRFVAGDDPLNIHMERGLRRHETFADARSPNSSEGAVFRHVAVRAPRVGVAGVLDEIVVGERLVVAEYKAARLVKWIWPAVLAQLAVQHLAFREHVATFGWHGPLLPEVTVLRAYYSESRRSREVEWSDELERVARRAVEEARLVLSAMLPPTGLVGPRCRECQHEPICLPWERTTFERAAGSAATL